MRQLAFKLHPKYNQIIQEYPQLKELKEKKVTKQCVKRLQRILLKIQIQVMNKLRATTFSKVHFCFPQWNETKKKHGKYTRYLKVDI